MAITKLSIPGEAVPKARPRLNRKTQTLYTPNNTKVFEECVALVALSTRARYTKETEVIAYITIYTAKKSPPDIDNCCKSILDGLQKGGLLENDSQVCELHVLRVKSNTPKTDITIVPMDEREDH